MYRFLESHDLPDLGQKTPYFCHFSFFSFGVTLYADRKDTVALFRAVYANFICPVLKEPDVTCHFISMSSLHNGPALIMNKTGFYSLPEKNGFIDYAELIIFKYVIERIKDSILLHAGVVSKNGNGYIIYAPSGFGKTTLVMELVSRGYKFLSDEFCSLRLSDSSIDPFPRKLGIKDDSPFASRIIPEKAYRFGLENKQFIECEDLFSSSLGKACKPKYFIELADIRQVENSHSETVHTFNLNLFNDNPSLIARLSQYDALDIGCRTETGCHVTYRISGSKGNAIIKVFQDIWKDFADDILGVFYMSPHKPDFNGSPRMKKMLKFNTILKISTHLVNRSPIGSLLDKHNGSVVALLADIGGAVKDVDCYTLSPGPLTEMADIIDSL
ncbi:MAG: hypothetical protein GY868_07780 [Deltaproteobacteria bacterium]|nr:hypothetical protein [Deltaproteobacteria bacterium]